MMTKVRRLWFVVIAIVAVLSLRRQLSLPPEDRTWRGYVFGIPYDYRVPTIDRVLERLWNPDDRRLIVPHVWGIGWTLNIYQVVERIRSLRA